MLRVGLRKNKLIKPIALILVQAVFVINIAWAYAIEAINSDTLAPQVQIGNIDFKGDYNNVTSSELITGQAEISRLPFASDEEQKKWLEFVENLNVQTNFPIFQLKTLDKGFQEIISTLEVSRDFLFEFFSKATPQEIENVFSRLTGRDFSVDQLSGTIQIEYLAQGTHKIVFKVTFFTKDKPLVLSLALKRSKEYDAISAGEIADLKWLSNIEREPSSLTPKFGVEFNTSNGQTMFLEEFVFGNTADSLRSGKGLTLEIRKKIVTTLLVAGMLLGNAFPRDFNYGNFIITSEEEAVMIDLGKKRLVFSQLFKHQYSPISFVEFFLTISMYYNQETSESVISDSYLDTIQRVRAYLSKRHPSSLRQGFKAEDLEQEFNKAIDITINTLINLSKNEKQDFLKRLEKRLRIGIFFNNEGKNFSQLERTGFLEKHLDIVLADLLKISNPSTGPPQTLEKGLILREGLAETTVFIENSI